MPYIGRSTDGFGVRNRFLYLASASDTSVSGADANGATLIFTDGAYVDVYLNGVLLKAGTDYNTNTANTIAGLSSMAANDEVTVIVYDVFTVGDMVSATSGGTFVGNVAMSGTLGVTGATTTAAITASGVVDITDTTDASDATGDTGALRTEGGASIAKKLYVGTDLDVDGTSNLDVVDIDGALTQDGGAVFNEDSADVDFRVESNDQAYMLFLDAGNNRVGVNASTPLAKLQVEGTTDAELRITRTTASVSGTFNDQGSVLHLFNDVNFENGYNGGASVGQIIFSSDDDSTGQGIRAKIGCSKLGYAHSESLDFYVSPSNTTSGQCTATSNTLGKRMTIDYQGNVGIGATPDAWHSNFTVVQFGGGDTGFIGHYDGGDTQIGTNLYYDGNWRAATTGTSSQYVVGASGYHIWYSNASASADAVVTLSERMRINTDGRVGVGDTGQTNTKMTITENTDNNITGLKVTTGVAGYDGITIWSVQGDTSSTLASTVLYGGYSNSAHKFLVRGDGDIETAGSQTLSGISDVNFKENIVDANSQWDDIKALKVRNYSWKEDKLDKANKIGLIAQEAELVSPNLVFTRNKLNDIQYLKDENKNLKDEDGNDIKDEDGNTIDNPNYGKYVIDNPDFGKKIDGETYKTLKYSVLYTKAVKALQEAMVRIETLEAKVKALEEA